MLQVLRNEAGLYQALRPSCSMMTRVLYLSRPPLNALSALKEKNALDKISLDVKMDMGYFTGEEFVQFSRRFVILRW